MIVDFAICLVLNCDSEVDCLASVDSLGSWVKVVDIAIICGVLDKFVQFVGVRLGAGNSAVINRYAFCGICVYF